MAAATRISIEPVSSPGARVRRKLARHPAALLGGAVVLLFVTVAIAAPLLAPFDPVKSNWLAVRKPPSAAFWLGSDELGRDILSRLLWGARASLLAGLVSVAIAVGVGVPLGVLAGYVGGWLDALVGRLTDALLACPFLILAIALAAFLGPSLGNAMIAIGVSATPIFIRLARGQTLQVKAEDHVLGARAIGCPHRRILLVYVLPAITAPILVQATLAIAAAIIAEASLSFLGLGQQPPAPSWGSMLDTARSFMTQAPWMAISPGLAIAVVVLAFNLLGDGLRDALDPREG